jgi:ubiquinol-cytochrome c reductase cytochrome b subunit
VVGGAEAGGALVIRTAVRYLDSRTGTAPFLRKALRYVFPDNWSFLLGEVALYTFIVLVGTGVYLTFFFNASSAPTVYHGSYAPLAGQQMSEAYKSVLELSTSVKAGLLIRQTHHWAANVFLVAIVLHLFRVFFTGAFRKPRELTYYIGVTMLVLALLEGYLGYSLADDLLSGMGLAIGYSVAMSIPLIGPSIAGLAWGGAFPGSPDFWPRMYAAHVLLLPVAIGTLLGAHLVLVALRHHTQFKQGPRETERRIVGAPTFPAQVPRSLGLMLVTVGVLFLLGGLFQINPIWQWGPYHVDASTNGAQPDWYLGWLIGALRLMPNWEPTVGGYTIVPNPFWGGVLLPTLVFGFLYLWPTVERRMTRDQAFHNLLERPRDRPWRTAVGMAVVTFAWLIFLAGSADRVQVSFGLSYTVQLQVYRVLVWALPIAVFFVTREICRELKAGDAVHEKQLRALAEAEAAQEAPPRPG